MNSFWEFVNGLTLVLSLEPDLLLYLLFVVLFLSDKKLFDFEFVFSSSEDT